MIFLKLFLAHLIGDFVLQPTRWVLHKEAHKIASPYLYYHIAIHAVLSFAILWDFSYWPVILGIVGLHYLIDLAKLYALPLFKNPQVPFFIDQLLHIMVIYLLVYRENFPEHFLELMENLDWGLITAILFVTWPSAVIMGKILEPMAAQIPTDHRSLPNAGKYIGIIERLFVLVFILTGRWEGIGLLITAKSVFRFNDLKESNSRKLTEYILIGTLMSFGLAIITGLIYLHFSPAFTGG